MRVTAIARPRIFKFQPTLDCLRHFHKCWQLNSWPSRSGHVWGGVTDASISERHWMHTVQSITSIHYNHSNHMETREQGATHRDNIAKCRWLYLRVVLWECRKQIQQRLYHFHHLHPQRHACSDTGPHWSARCTTRIHMGVGFCSRDTDTRFLPEAICINILHAHTKCVILNFKIPKRQLYPLKNSQKSMETMCMQKTMHLRREFIRD